MGNKTTLTLIGGDKRQLELIHLFSQHNIYLKVFGFKDIFLPNVSVYNTLCSDLFKTDVLILPVPYKNKSGYIEVQYNGDPINPKDLMNELLPNTLILLGKADPFFIEEAALKSIQYYDILTDETFSVLNAIPSAEGAIQRAMEITDITIHNAKVLVLGFGRIGKTLARMLKGIGALVTVEARKSTDLAWIHESGYKGIHLMDLDKVLPYQDIIFNTVPHMILNKERLKKVDSKAVIIDLASSPGGVDFAAANELGITAGLHLGLPGIVAPRTAARIIYQTAKEVLRKNNIEI